jgi:hypothetical protein
MSADITHSKEFNTVCNFDTTHNNVAKQDNTEVVIQKISMTCTSVIQHLQSSENKSDREKIAQFSQKVSIINGQFEAEGKGVPFAVHLYTLNLLTELKEKLSANNQSITKHPFLLQLKHLSAEEEIESPIEVAKSLYSFQKNTLIPALEAATSLEELEALKPVIILCSSVANKVSEVDKKGVLKELVTDSKQLYIFKIAKLDPVYVALTEYEPGSLASLEQEKRRSALAVKLNKCLDNIERAISTGLVPIEDKVTIYNALIAMQQDFAVHGAGEELDAVINRAASLFSVQKGIKSSFPIELPHLSSEEIQGPLKPILKKLAVFERDHLIPALQGVSSQEELKALEPLVDQCIALKEKVHAVDKGTLEDTHLKMIHLYNAKDSETKPIYSFLLSYEKGGIENLDQKPRREKVATGINNFIKSLVPQFEHTIFKEPQKRALYDSLIQIQQEFETYGDGVLLDPAIKEMRKVLGIPEPKLQVVQQSKQKEPAPKKDLFALWEKRAEAANKQQVPSNAVRSGSKAVSTPVRKQKEVSPEVLRERALQIVQTKLSSLDIQSGSFRADILETKEQINVLRNLPGSSKIEFTHLEKALDVLLNPETLAVSSEEKLLMGFVLEKHKLSKLDLAKFVKKDEDINKPDDLKKISARVLASYVEQERFTVSDAQSNMLRALKQKALHPEQLEATASRVVDIARSTAKQMRFKLFTDAHALTPPLNHQFTAHFPALASVFEQFNREVVLKEFESKWTEIEHLYDLQLNGKFSDSLATYSYINPRRQFGLYAEDCQNDFLGTLNFQAIDRMSSEELSNYLERKVDDYKSVPAEYFGRSYASAFQEQHIWLFGNIQRIKTPYNQGDEDNTNLGEGVCYNNSLYRMRQLFDDPNKRGDPIAMGSNPTTRNHQNKVNRYYLEAKEGKITYEQAGEHLKKNCGVYGLAHHYTHTVSVDGDIHQNFVNDIEQFSNLNYKQVVLVIRKPSGVGHAVNLQFDNANGIYRMCDDNIGHIEFENLAVMKAELKEYFKQYYKGYTQYQFECYKKA